MQIAIALTLGFFAVVSGLGALRDSGRARVDPRPSRYLGVATACVVTVWCLLAAIWQIRHALGG